MKIEASPRAAVAVSWLLRQTVSLSVADALVAESAVYSMLLAGPDFHSWLARRGPARSPDGPERVRLTRDNDELRITLARPARRNAVDAAMRNALVDALQIAHHDDRRRVILDADGPPFSAGGDLDEFGTAIDPATAHLVRVTANVGRLISELSQRIEVRVHGDCIGAGI
jgi:enoyl-CoA hydratase/isomerase-like protein